MNNWGRSKIKSLTLHSIGARPWDHFSILSFRRPRADSFTLPFKMNIHRQIRPICGHSRICQMVCRVFTQVGL